MATNFIQKGDVIDYTPSSAVESGDVVVIGSLVGVATTDIAASAEGAVAIEGVWEIPRSHRSPSLSARPCTGTPTAIPWAAQPVPAQPQPPPPTTPRWVTPSPPRRPPAPLSW